MAVEMSQRPRRDTEERQRQHEASVRIVERRLASTGLQRVNTPADGNCFFIAAAWSVGIHIDPFALRQQVVSYLRTYSSLFSQWFDTQWAPFSHYLEAMSRGPEAALQKAWMQKSFVDVKEKGHRSLSVVAAEVARKHFEKSKPWTPEQVDSIMTQGKRKWQAVDRSDLAEVSQRQCDTPVPRKVEVPDLTALTAKMGRAHQKKKTRFGGELAKCDNSIADEPARWSCRDCTSSVDWSPALNPVDIETGTMPLEFGVLR
eukprot:s4444_g2.t1